MSKAEFRRVSAQIHPGRETHRDSVISVRSNSRSCISQNLFRCCHGGLMGKLGIGVDRDQREVLELDRGLDALNTAFPLRFLRKRQRGNSDRFRLVFLQKLVRRIAVIKSTNIPIASRGRWRRSHTCSLCCSDGAEMKE
jgi:hypothetical protein